MTRSPTPASSTVPQIEQATIIRELRVAEDCDLAAETGQRVDFLVGELLRAAASGYVLAVSGGVDSFTAGCLCRLAAERLRRTGFAAALVAMRLPYRAQADAADADLAIAVMRPDVVLTLDVGPACDALAGPLDYADELGAPIASRDFVLGNIKARQRMVAQYAVANAYGLLVVGTDHAAEAVVGFFTKHGDGACDVAPLAGLTKRRVRALARALGADERTVTKTPTADLESDRPGLPDEEALGLSYDEIDDFLEGREVAEAIHDRIVTAYRRTAHKRRLPAAPIVVGCAG
jgi:NAD+ synthase